MSRLANTFSRIFFWWTLFLLLLIFGFNVKIPDLTNNIFSYNIHFSIVSILLLISPIFYILLYIIEFVKDRTDGLSLMDTIGLTILPNFWAIYYGFRFWDFEFPTSIINLIENFLWWGLLAYSVWTIVLTNDGNVIISKINEFSNEQIFIRLGTFILACLLLYAIGKLLFHISGKVTRDYMD